MDGIRKGIIDGDVWFWKWFGVGKLSGKIIYPRSFTLVHTEILTTTCSFSYFGACFALVPTYMLCQLMGATLASITLKVLYHDKVDIGVTMTQLLSSTSDLEAVVWESIITSTLALTICGVTTDHRGSKDLAGVAIGISVLINVIIAGPINGASMNPARSLGPAIVSGDYKNIWVFLTGPTLGAVSASMLYTFLRVSKPAKLEDRT